MKKYKKTIKSICLFTVLLLFLALAACSNKSDPIKMSENENPSDGVDSAETEKANEVLVRIEADLPEKNFGGHEFKIITSDPTIQSNIPQEIGAEEETGDPINDAIYKRNKKIEEQYNVKIKEILYNRFEMEKPVQKVVRAADNSYDLVCGLMGQSNIMAQRGDLLDLAKVNYIDLKKPWYDQNASADLSIGHKLFFATGDLQISNKDAVWVVLFNKKLFQDLGFKDDPYTLVRSGKWTMDKMFEFATAATKDLNGDGVMTEEDQWGMLGESFSIYALQNGSGTRLIQKDENDMPYYAGYTSRDIDIFEKGAEFLADKNKSILAENYMGKYSAIDIWDEFINPMFATDRVQFFFTSLSRVTYLRDYGTDFGILPTPKYDENQANYVNTVSPGMACSYSILVTFDGDDLDRSAIIAEALTAESKYTLIPAYYELQLKTKFVRDNESAEMLEMIFANRTYSLLMLYNWGGMYSSITGMLTQNSRNFVSSMDKIESKIANEIEKTIKIFDSK
jgi:ABC-type glycerol-3-phosphate transport system substrate-binding protein